MKFTVIVEKDKSGYFVASVPELPGCHTQAKNLNELSKRIKEAIQVYLETKGDKKMRGTSDFVGVQLVEVNA